MFNYHYEKVGQTYWQYSDKEDAFLVKAQRKIDKGDAVKRGIENRIDMRKLWDEA